jgi:hypothetical protein
MFKYKGSFEIKFTHSTFSSPQAITDYLTPIVKKIAAKKDYIISDVLDDKNMND